MITGGDDTCPHWEGYIHEVREEEDCELVVTCNCAVSSVVFSVVQVRSGDILIKFADVFHDTYDNQDVDVMFAFNRCDQAEYTL